jgi:hypothetical protein
VCGKPETTEVIERSRINIASPKMPGAIQPYHYAEKLDLTQAEQHVNKCRKASSDLALAALREVLRQLQSRDYRVAGAAILLSSARPLPEFTQILKSHALIHTAEGEFFRCSFRDAFEQLGIPVTGIPERQMEEHAKSRFGKGFAQVQKHIAAMGRSLGPPWTADQKNAALAALIVLSN